MGNVFSKNLRELRKERKMSQEELAEKFGITVQSVSKWECAVSYPDIELLPKIADLFHVTVDDLLRSGMPQHCLHASEVLDLPDDGMLRIVQCKGNVVLRKDKYDPNQKIPLFFDREILEKQNEEVQLEIWGSAEIEGDICGSVNAGGGVNCGTVGGDVSAGVGVDCGDVGDSISAGDGVNCGDVGGSVNAGGEVNCGTVGGDVSAGGGVDCGDVGGSVNAGDEVNCGDVQ